MRLRDRREARRIAKCCLSRRQGMSASPELRRADRAMTDDEIVSFLRSSQLGRLATASRDGCPYCLPLLYVFLDGCILVHGTAERGHLRTNVENSPKVCFEI